MAVVSSIYSKMILDASQYEAALRNITRSSEQATSKIEKDTEKAAKGFDDLGKNAEKASKKIDMMSEAMNLIASSAITTGMLNIGKSVVSMSGQFEKYISVLKVALGTQAKAEQAMSLIQDTASKTPFAVTELTESYIKYVNRGIKPTQEELIKLGDLSASQGKSFDQLTEAVLDAMGGEFERLKEFGIKASQANGKVTLSFRGLSQTVNNTEEDIKKLVLSFGAMEGISGSMAAVSQTLEGRISNLGDATDFLKKAIGDELLPTVKQVTIFLIQGIEAITKWKNENPALARTMIQLALAAGAILTVMVGANGLIAAMKLFPALASTMGLSINAMLGPIGLVTAGLGAMLLMINRAEQEVKDLAAGINEKDFKDTVNEFGDDVGKYQKALEELIRLRNEASKFNKGEVFKGSEEGLRKGSSRASLREKDLFRKAEIGESGYSPLGDSRTIVNIELIDARIKSLQDRIGELGNKTEKTAKQTAGAGKATKEFTLTIEELIKQGITLDNLNGGEGIRLEIETDPKNAQKVNELKQFISSIKGVVDTELDKGQIKLKIDIPSEQLAQNKLTIEKHLSELNKVAKKSPVSVDMKKEKGTGDPFGDWEKATGPLLQVENQFKSLHTQYMRFTETVKSGNVFQMIGAGAKLGVEAINSLGQQFLALRQAQTQLIETNIRNQRQMSSALSDYMSGIWDKEDRAFNKHMESQIESLESQKAEIERIESEHLAKLDEMKKEFDETEKKRIDELYNAQVLLKQKQLDDQLLQLQATTANQDQYNALAAIAVEDFENSKKDLREQFDEQYAQSTTAKEQEIAQQKSEIEDQKQAKLEAIDKQKEIKENEKLAREEASEKKRADLKQKIALFQYSLDLAAFQASKHLQIQTAKMQMAMGLLQAISAGAMIAATIPIVGWVLGPAFAAMMSGMILAAGMTSIAAIASMQPPPPPAAALGLASGGVAPMSMGRPGIDSIPAMLSPGELVVPTENFEEVVNSVKGNREGGQVVVNMTNNFTDRDDGESIVKRISERLVQDIQYGMKAFSY